MKKYIVDFLRRGIAASGIGPLVLAVLYTILYICGVITEICVLDMCIGIFSLFALAFVAGGINFIYQIERLSIMTAVSIHGLVLYFGYLVTYIINGWLESGWWALLVFTVVFIIGYLTIWAVIFTIVKRRTKRINEILDENRCTSNE